jgi:transcriptional regulator with XRE-family HTH domain
MDVERRVESITMSERDLENLGKAITLLRTRRNLNGAALAERAGVSRAMLSCYENAANAPSLKSLSRILEGLGADFGDLQHAITLVEAGVDPEGGGVGEPLVGLVRRDASREALADALVAIRRFCTTALGELGHPDEEG